ncbi:AarF/UbiB family protein [Candidatus Latescibacterota bacterium]
MNVIGFIRLLRTIYSNKLPDLDFIQRQGLLAVKIGQTYALRLDFLNEETCKHLGQLYRHVDSLSADNIDKLLDSYVDHDWRIQFERIDLTPLASASVGQVHQGQLKSGQDVVIKIIKTDFRKRFIRDVQSLRRFVKFILFFYPKLEKVADPLGIIDTIETGTLDELDLCREIEGHDRLKSIYEKNRTQFDLSKLSFPIIHRNISNTNILVSEYIEGKTFDELLGEKEMTYDMLLDLFHLHGFYVFCIGTFHGDIHPGNIILHGGQIYFLDTGVISTVGKKMRVGLFDFFDSLSQYDYVKCAENLNRMAEQSISGDAYQLFQKKFLELYSDYTNSTVSQVSLTKKMMETIKLGVNSGMVFEKGMYPIIKSLMYLDGMVLRCNPDAMLVKDMRRFIEDFKSIVYSSPGDEVE